MGMVVRTNVMAMNAQRQLNINNKNLSKSIEKLSSGFKINRSADDAAGLAISERMKAQIQGLDAASSNAEDGISLVQTAEGALGETHDMLNRMVTLATKAANGVLTESQRRNYSDEVSQLKSEIDRIADSTNFNSLKLLDGSLSAGSAAPGADAKLVLDQAVADSLSTSAGVVGQMTTGAVKAFNTNGTAGEATYSFTINNNGVDETHTIKLSLAKDAATGATFSYSLDGGAMKSTTADIAATKAASATEVADALIEVIGTTDWGKNFSVTNGTGALTFEAKEVGTSAPSLKGLSVVKTDAGAAVKESLSVTQAQAAYDKVPQLDYSKLSVGAGESKAAVSSKVFEIGGRKFAILGADADAASKAHLGDDVVQITIAGNGGAAATAADSKTISDKINEVVGHQVVYQQTGTTDANLSIGSDPSKAVTGNGGLTLQVGDTYEKFNMLTVSIEDQHAKALGLDKVDITTQEAAGKSIDVINAAIDSVSTTRSTIGAIQNRLDHTINNLNTTSENLNSANSRIRDTDMAKEMMEYTKINVLTQSAQAMLAQANQQPQSVLQLLQ